MAGLHEEARGYPSCQGWDIGRLSQQGCVGRSVWLLAMLVGCFLDTMAGAIFFHLIRECNTSSKQFSPNWPEMLKPNPERIPLPLSLRVYSPTLPWFFWNVKFSHKSLGSVWLFTFLYLKIKLKYIVGIYWDAFPLGDLKKNKIILLNGKLNTWKQVVWKW